MREGEGALSDVRLYLSRDNLLINMDRLVSEEGWVASCHLIDQHPQSPPVHRFVVALHVGREGEGRERGAKGEGEGRERGAKGEGEGRERGAKGEGDKHNTMHLETLQPSDIIYSALYTHLPYISLRVMVLP